MSYTVAVRALCEFVAKRGDLDLRFTPAPTAQEGIAGHQLVTARRGAGYQAEVALAGAFQHLQVRGRADGYDPQQQQVEEIKTFRGDLARQPDNHRQLHWAQAKVYGWLLCETLALTEITVALVYFDIASQQETLISERYTAAALQQHFAALCGQFLAWADQELAHRAARDAALSALAFPHPEFRHGQRQLAEAIYKTASRGHCLLAQAPTGIGKTVGSLFPMLKAMPRLALDKLYFLSAKSSGRRMALGAASGLSRMLPVGTLRVLELLARDKACEYPDKACHGDSCPLAQGFYDRLSAARSAAVGLAVLDQASLREVALAHQVCPYYLSQDLTRWADVVIGDYNYYFDLSALLYGLQVQNQWRVGLLIDEAHNMLERARKMYSATLSQTALKDLRRNAPAALKKPLDKLDRTWRALFKEQLTDYQVYAAPPDKFLLALQQANGAIGEFFVENPLLVLPELQQFHFDTLLFVRLAEQYGTHSLFDISLYGLDREAAPTKASTARASSTLCLRNVLPAPFLTPRFAAAHCSVLFSATLSPPRFYQDTLGLPPESAWIDIESPFAAEQLRVHLVGSISTRYGDRERSLAPIADLIARQYTEEPGNYLAFFSSFDYLQQVVAQVQARHPGLPIWIQARGMAEGEQSQFLERFTASSQGVAFAVLGGAFAEGIDLPGKRLIGAFIATLGLPQINAVNEAMLARMSELFGAGYDYTYLFPGLQKVVQAAGRVIRTPSDRGTLYLIDDRYMQAKVKGLLPAWWSLRVGRSA